MGEVSRWWGRGCALLSLRCELLKLTLKCVTLNALHCRRENAEPDATPAQKVPLSRLRKIKMVGSPSRKR